MPDHIAGIAAARFAAFSPLERQVIRLALRDGVSPRAPQSWLGRSIGRLLGAKYALPLASPRLEALRCFVADRCSGAGEDTRRLVGEGFSKGQIRALLDLPKTRMICTPEGNCRKRIAALAGSLLLFLLVAASPHRQVEVTVYGSDPCPQANGDEIVVCAQEPESERYRIPKRLREPKRTDVASQSWTARVRTLEEASRPSMPNSCSAVGSGGQTGCTAMMLRQWFLERRAAAVEAAAIP